MNALRNLGFIEAVLCGFSYIWARVRPPKDQNNYEGWLVARFGWRLYRHFFKTYTKKVWGVPVSDMPADWAARRAKTSTCARPSSTPSCPSTARPTSPPSSRSSSTPSTAPA